MNEEPKRMAMSRRDKPVGEPRPEDRELLQAAADLVAAQRKFIAAWERSRDGGAS